MNSIDEELIEVVGENNLPEVRRLLSVGADVNAKDRFGNTPLIEASCYGHLQVFQALLDHGADIEAKDNFGRTPLHEACWKGHLPVVNELLSPNDGNGATSIHGKRMSRGANVEARDRFGNTPLHAATDKDHLSVVKALVSGGADILATNNNGELPIHHAVYCRSMAVSKYLLQELYATTRRLPLHELVHDLTWIDNPSSRDLDYPPLRAALHLNVLGMNDVAEIVDYLVDQNPALLTSRDQDGSLPLHVACRRAASFTVVQSLVNHYKASVMSVTSEGDLPLFLACEMPKTSLDTIFVLVKLYPDLVFR
jgi:ankyrin repeat protein